MLHDVAFDAWDDASGRLERFVVQVDAEGGDDAASQAALKAALFSPKFKIVSIAPAGAPQVVEAVAEGADAPQDAA